MFKNKYLFLATALNKEEISVSCEFTFKFYHTKNFRIRIYDEENQFIETLENKELVSKKYNIPKRTLTRYIKYSRLYKNKYYFYNHE